MKILHCVEFYYPSTGGAQEVVKQLSERLVKLGNDVTVATTDIPERNQSIINGVKIKEFKISGNYAHGFHGDTLQYQNFLITSEFDIIMFYAAQQWTTDLALPVLEKIKPKKVIVPCGFSGLYLPEYNDYFSKMKNWLKKFDACVYLSNEYRDIEFARQQNIDNGIIIPNGAAEDEFSSSSDNNIKKRLSIPKNDFLIIHVGSHTGLKGHKEAIKIFKKANISHCTFLIIGDKCDSGCWKSCRFSQFIFQIDPRMRINGKKLKVIQLSRKDTIAAYHNADLFLFPSNIECSPIVLFECMASKTPFLTTDVGNSKEIIKWSNGGILLPTIHQKNGYCFAKIDESAIILEKISLHEEYRIKMSNNGYKKWREQFRWEDITKRYYDLYLKLCNEI